MVHFGPWTWDEIRKQHWCDKFDDNNAWLDRIWSGREESRVPRTGNEAPQLQLEDTTTPRRDSVNHDYVATAEQTHTAQSQYSETQSASPPQETSAAQSVPTTIDKLTSEFGRTRVDEPASQTQSEHTWSQAQNAQNEYSASRSQHTPDEYPAPQQYPNSQFQPTQTEFLASQSQYAQSEYPAPNFQSAQGGYHAPQSPYTESEHRPQGAFPQYMGGGFPQASSTRSPFPHHGFAPNSHNTQPYARPSFGHAPNSFPAPTYRHDPIRTAPNFYLAERSHPNQAPPYYPNRPQSTLAQFYPSHGDSPHSSTYPTLPSNVSHYEPAPQTIVAKDSRNRRGSTRPPKDPTSLDPTHQSTHQRLRIHSTESAQPQLPALPRDVQASVQSDHPDRLIRTGMDPQDEERLDPRYRRVKSTSQAAFFVPGRVFKMLWTEPAGPIELGQSRRGTHFSISTVRWGEYAHSEIRRFVVIRNNQTFSTCIPIHTYHGRAATKPGIQAHLHGVIHTSYGVPELLPGERGKIFKQPVRVMSTPRENNEMGEELEPESRVNYGKPYAVEHNVKVLDIGLVWEGHLQMVLGYFDNAITKGA